MLRRSLLFLALIGCAAAAPKPVIRQGPAAPTWTPLFDGRSLESWRPTSFGGEGLVRVEQGAIRLEQGETLTGVTWTGAPPPTMNYELRLQARRIAGDDFFCGLTFPVGADHASLIVGGWGGMTVGISSLDDLDASENETSRLMTFVRDRWYQLRVRVTPDRIAAWIDDQPVVDVATVGRRISVRAEVKPSRPLGVATWRTSAELRAIQLRRL